jgi:hypothetical protein
MRTVSKLRAVQGRRAGGADHDVRPLATPRGFLRSSTLTGTWPSVSAIWASANPNSAT